MTHADDYLRRAFEAWWSAATFESLGADWYWSAWQAGAAAERARHELRTLGPGSLPTLPPPDKLAQDWEA